MSLMRRVLGSFLLVMAALGGARAESVDKLPQPTSYVSDFAGVVDTASKQNLEALCGQVYAKAHATIEVVTIKSLDGADIDEFTTALEDKWKVGRKGTDKGVILLFAIQDHKRRIEVGYGLEGILNDAKVGDIGRSMVPQLQQGNYGLAMQVGVQQIADVIAQDAGVTLTPPSQTVNLGRPAYSVQRHGTSWVRLVIFLIFLAVLLHGGGRGGGGGSGWLWFLLGNMMGGGFGGGRGGFGGGNDEGGGGGGGGGGDFGGGFGGGSGGGGASGDW